ncbi:hypothetical protein Hdeb2414_s0089g00787331 [Helianthus debilis subsp. tardiflorus]
MALEQVFADQRDSKYEVDDDVAGLEDRRILTQRLCLCFLR